MANRFSTLTQYHSLILGHGVLAAITFLFIIPISVIVARFYNRRPGFAVRYHAYLQILALLLTTVVFILGFFAVGPPKSYEPPSCGIGVAIYVLLLLQGFGGRLVKNIEAAALAPDCSFIGGLGARSQSSVLSRSPSVSPCTGRPSTLLSCTPSGWPSWCCSTSSYATATKVTLTTAWLEDVPSQPLRTGDPAVAF